MATMKVAKGRSMMTPKGAMLKAGTIIEDSHGFSDKDIEHGVREGFVVPFESNAGPVYETPPPATKAKDMSEAEAVRMTERTRVEGPAAVVESKPKINASVSQKESIWDTDPATLEGKDLDALQIMILDRDPDFDLSTITSVELAVEYLSQDFVAPEGD